MKTIFSTFAIFVLRKLLSLKFTRNIAFLCIIAKYRIPVTLMPLWLTFFQNLVFFLFSLIKSQHKNVLTRSIDSLKKIRTTRSYFNQPLFETNLYKFSFMSIAIRLLNSFIYSNVNNTDTIFRSAFEKVALTLYHSNTKHWT